jgi:hydrogenase expression/formation protein HypE
VLPVTGTMMRMPELRFMRDPSHGGMATVAQETACVAAASVWLFEQQLPIRNQVARICEILGCDPLELVCEGRMAALLGPASAAAAVGGTRAGGFSDARDVGVVEPGASRVVLQTMLGGERTLPELDDDPIPRTC